MLNNSLESTVMNRGWEFEIQGKEAVIDRTANNHSALNLAIKKNKLDKLLLALLYILSDLIPLNDIKCPVLELYCQLQIFF